MALPSPSDGGSVPIEGAEAQSIATEAVGTVRSGYSTQPAGRAPVASDARGDIVSR